MCAQIPKCIAVFALKVHGVKKCRVLDPKPRISKALCCSRTIARAVRKFISGHT
jgi:hypothetical protein